jgi:integrase
MEMFYPSYAAMALRQAAVTRPHKGRAIVPMLRTAKAALREAEAGVLSDSVIEWADKRVKSLKRGIKTARVEAGISKTVSPHIQRHSAAVHMAEDRRSMEEIQQPGSQRHQRDAQNLRAILTLSQRTGSSAGVRYPFGEGRG